MVRAERLSSYQLMSRVSGLKQIQVQPDYTFLIDFLLETYYSS